MSSIKCILQPEAQKNNEKLFQFIRTEQIPIYNLLNLHIQLPMFKSNQKPFFFFSGVAGGAFYGFNFTLGERRGRKQNKGKAIVFQFSFQYWLIFRFFRILSFQFLFFCLFFSFQAYLKYFLTIFLHCFPPHYLANLFIFSFG